MSRNVAISGLLILAAAGLAAGFVSNAARPGEAEAQTQAVEPARFTPASFRFAKAPGNGPAGLAEDGDAPPISLTASDGTGLALVALEANGLLEPPLAFTELRLTFENPRDETIEGRFRIALPPGAALSRFAMKIGEAWQEGEVVERQRARQTYEEFLHQRQDPALLEQEAGNEFSARVFPIPARGRKELIVSYSHALPRADEPYVLPLRGLSEIGRLDVRVLLGDRPAGGGTVSSLGGQVSDRRMIELHKQAWTPDRDLEIRQEQAGSRAGLRQGNLAVVRVTPAVEAAPQEIAGLYVLVDSSASRALGYAAQVRRVEELIAGLREGAGGSTPVGVAAFDQEVVPVYEGPASGFGPAEARRLGGRRPLGASDLAGALAWLGERVGRGGRFPRVLLVTDGVATAGETEARALKAAVRSLGKSGVRRLDVLAFGGLRDDAALRELTTGNLEHDGQRIDGDAPLPEIARRLTLACRSGLRVKVEGAAWAWPETLDGVQPGDQALVYADLPASRPLRLTLDGKPAPLPGELAAVERPLLERAWVQARIERLLHLREADHAEDDDLRRAIAREITELSVENRVLSPFTAMLVLETENDYARFGLDRRALADILTVGAGGLEVLARSRSAIPATRMAVETGKEPRADLEALGYVGDAAAPESEPEAEVGGVEGGVVGSVAGGVAGGVPGGVPSPVEVPAAAMPPPPPPPPPAPSAARPAPRAAEPVAGSETDDTLRRVEGLEEARKVSAVEPLSGRFAEVMKHLAAGRIAPARERAESWSAESPGDVLALLALGEVWEAAGEKAAAARAYGSVVDLFPGRADMRRLAGERLERLGETGIALAVDTYRKAVLDRPDHLSGHRLLAWALLRAGRFEEAFEALESGLEQKYPGGRFAGASRVLKEDLGLLAAAWLRAEPARSAEVLDRLRARDARLEQEPSLRFVLSWETDANDVDLHVYDRRGNHASFSQKTLPSGGELYADVTTGYGPECFTVRDPAKADAGPYRLLVHYYRRGPMGYGMGTVQVVHHDGKGGISVDARPFVVMADDAMVDVGAVKAR